MVRFGVVVVVGIVVLLVALRCLYYRRAGRLLQRQGGDCAGSEGLQGVRVGGRVGRCKDLERILLSTQAVNVTSTKRQFPEVRTAQVRSVRPAAPLRTAAE
jgi:hypothetical protein